MNNKSEINKILIDAITIMKPKVKKVIKNTPYQEQEDLEQDINLKIVNAVKGKRIKPVTF